MTSPGLSPALFFDTISAYQRTEALRAALELDLFSQVAAGHQTATQIAHACQAAPRGVRILADYLTSLGFLHKHGDRYELTADTKVFLDRQSPAYLGGTLEFIPEPDRIMPPSTANFALVMLATTACGDAYTFAELQATFARAGFLRSEFHALAPTTQQAVVSYKG